jgi:hypothetical protein
MYAESRLAISQVAVTVPTQILCEQTMAGNPFQEKLPFRVRAIWRVRDDAERICSAHFVVCISPFESCWPYVA